MCQSPGEELRILHDLIIPPRGRDKAMCSTKSGVISSSWALRKMTFPRPPPAVGVGGIRWSMAEEGQAELI